MDFVYHGSTKQGLKTINPGISTHGKNWVYATPTISSAALFIGKNYDFICQIGIEDGKPYLYEQFEGALEYAYKDQAGSIYTLSASSFRSGLTGWSAELVTEKPQIVKKEHKIPDILEFIFQLEKEGRIKIYRYPTKPSNAPKNKEDILTKAVEWTKAGKDMTHELSDLHPDLLPRFKAALKAS